MLAFDRLCKKKSSKRLEKQSYFFAEIVELKEGGSRPGDGDLLLGGLHLSCDMYSGLKA